ncbi:MULTISPECIES: hypothetical protein [Campylobacter]|uniref:hypothetical protein n=1 Tax=Campylobacter TaxID=194 RepID=UPI000A34B5C8|nr:MULTISPECIES: hypothetical protein [unclassified Campylobacter]MCR8679439.1 hypothetical protein [Campylobacter sp. RM19072]MCR8696485.1 hypothetical protein [Campylobacter sp. RM19073]MEE3703981.1 hypothetical protein [Campylobacter sp. CX2-8023-23]MEE3775884.1 hypothetical protein [Campylobacter sp. CX2-4080-23]
MKKAILLVMILCSFGFGDIVSVEGFESDLYSKYDANNLKKISMDLEIITRDDDVPTAPIYDALNIIVGSFYAEDIMTSKGKEGFKTTLIKYIDKKHSIAIEEIYIIKLKFVEETNIQKILDAIKSINKNTPNSSEPASVLPNLPKIENLIQDNNFDKNF